MTVLDLPPRQATADAPPLRAIRPCRLRQPEPPSRAEIVIDRLSLAIVAAMTLMFIVQGLRALHHAGWF